MSYRCISGEMLPSSGCIPFGVAAAGDDLPNDPVTTPRGRSASIALVAPRTLNEPVGRPHSSLAHTPSAWMNHSSETGTVAAIRRRASSTSSMEITIRPGNRPVEARPGAGVRDGWPR